MSAANPYEFDIDVDLSPLLGSLLGPTLVNSRWYEMLGGRQGRNDRLQQKITDTFRNTMMHAQWRATSRKRLDRRRAIRAPLLSRVQVEGGKHLVACDISLSGLRCSGRPTAPLMSVEFRIPGLDFPIDARVEVVSFKDANVIPLVGLRFAWIDPGYLNEIAEYVTRRREKSLAA